MAVRRLDTVEPGAVTDGDAEEVPIPGEVVNPGLAGDALEHSVRLRAVPRLVPRLEAQRGDAVFRAGQGFRRAQHVHPCAIRPYAGALGIGCRIDHGYLADPGASQREGESAARLSAADDQHVVVDAGPVRYPIRRIGSEQPQRLPSAGVGIGHAASRPFSTCPPAFPVASPFSIAAMPLTIVAAMPSAFCTSRRAPPGRSVSTVGSCGFTVASSNTTRSAA